jgi:hypothetical protein
VRARGEVRWGVAKGREKTTTDLWSLVVLDDAAERTLGRSEGTVEQVHVDLLGVSCLLDTASDLECSRFCQTTSRQSMLHADEGEGGRTVVCAVADTDELLVLSLVREPGLEIVLFGGGVVERSRDDRDELVRQLERLVKVLRVLDHRVEHGPRGSGVGDAELSERGVSDDSNPRRDDVDSPAQSSQTDGYGRYQGRHDHSILPPCGNM